LVRKNIGSWKKRFQLIITPDSWENSEERDQFIKQLLSRRRFPRTELIEVLKNSYAIGNRDKRKEIVEAVGTIFSEARNVDIPTDLLDLFKSTSDQELRKWIIANLPKFSKDAIVPEIITLYRHPNRVYRLAANKLLDQYDLDIVADCLADELIQGNWANRTDPLRFLNEIAPDKILEPCKYSLSTGSEADRKTAIELLSELRTNAAMKILKEAADDNSRVVRLAVANAVSRIPENTSIDILLKFTSDSKTAVVIQALEGIRRLGEERSIPAVVKCVHHEDSNVRAQSLATLGEIGTAEHLELLIEGIKDPDIHIRQSALQATIHISRKKGIDVVRLVSTLMNSENVNVRRAAAQIIGQVNVTNMLEKVFGYLQDNDWWVREMVANSLAKLKDDRVFPAVVDLLSHPDPSLRRYAVDILISIGNRKAVMPIIQLLKDQDWWVRERAVVALGKLGTSSVIDILCSLLDIPELIYSASGSLGEIGHSSAIEPLMEHLEKADDDAKLAIMTALEKLKAIDAIPIIEKYLIADNREIRNKAKEVLTRLKVDPEKLNKLSERWWEQHDLSILDTMLLEARHQSTTELLLSSNQPLLARINNDLVPISKEILTVNQILTMISNILTPGQEKQFHSRFNLDFSYEIDGGGRYHGNLLKHANGVNLVFKIIPDTLPDLDKLDLPEIINKLSKLENGLILVTGPISCGKKTTLAAIVNKINENRKANIITIEDPIGFVHPRKNCLVTQREVGRHTSSFPRALRAALREDPDVILISDLRDRETISMALTAAESGHLVLASMCSISTAETIDKIIQTFPVDSQDHIRTVLSESLQVVVSQLLIPGNTKKMAIATEILINTTAVSSIIRENKLFQLGSLITAGGKHGMMSMDQSLIKLVKENQISRKEAFGRSQDKKQFENYLKELGD